MCNNTGYRCLNLTKEQCDALSLATGVSDIVTATLSLSLLVCLLAIKKTNAWNTGIKRATIVFSVYLTISSLNLGAVMFYNGFLPFGYCEVMHFINLYIHKADHFLVHGGYIRDVVDTDRITSF